MHYLTHSDEIFAAISELAFAKILWLDTEVADYMTNAPRLSLIQALEDPSDFTGEKAYILDVLDKPDLQEAFIRQIMACQEIEKVFHNAAFDLKFLGGKRAKNVTCTFKISKKIRKEKLGTSNLKLKTLAKELCHFSNVDTEEGTSDWGQRPLTSKQLQYAMMDPVYLAHVHQYLLKFLRSHYPSFSVTSVRVAFECPRLFYLSQTSGGKTLFIPANHSKGLGTTFHKLAERLLSFAKQDPSLSNLFKAPPAVLQVDDIAPQLQKIFYELVFFPYLQKAICRNSAQALAFQSIWQGLTHLIRHWTTLLIQNRHYCIAETVIQETFVAQETNIEYSFPLPDGNTQKIVGKLDSLLFNLEKQRLCVAEYKTYEPVDASAQLAQVALYSYMIWQQKKVAVDSAVYCVLPEFKEYYYSWEQLEKTVHTLIPHKLQQMREWLNWKTSQPNSPPPTTQPSLCEICPQSLKCQSTFPERV